MDGPAPADMVPREAENPPPPLRPASSQNIAEAGESGVLCYAIIENSVGPEIATEARYVNKQ